MMYRLLRRVAYGAVLLQFFGVFFPHFLAAQWHADSTTNTPVCDTVGQQDMPKGCSDGADGAIFVWEDARASTYQVYAQHLNAAGRATWTRNGVKLATLARGTYLETNPIVTTDDSGGAYVVWLDGRYGSGNGTCLYAQHIRSDGTLAYPDSGLTVGVGLNGCANPAICDDGRGGAFVAWEDYRTSFVSSRPDIWINRLWPGGVKFGLAVTGTKGVVSSTYNWYTHKTTYYFTDTSANFQPYLANLSIAIPGKGSYPISAVPSPTQLTLKTYPANGTYAYFVPGLTGIPLDTFQNKQTAPQLISDGTGGCYCVWISNSSVPNGVYGTRIDTNCQALWDPMPGPGFLIFKSLNTSNPAKNVYINRDGNELLLSWEVTNSDNNTQQVYAQRMRNNDLYDTAFEWNNTAVDVTSDGIDDHTSPRIFSDDSTINGVHGALVPFLFTEPGSTDDIDPAMIRILGDGGNLEPPAGNGLWYLAQKPHGQIGYRAVKITDNTNPTNTGIIAVWNDAWDGTDTMVYAQRIDRNGKKYFPTPGTANRWGQAITGDSSATRRWTAKQVTLVARDNGAIAAWTDFRNGNADIYAQLIPGDGIFSIPTDLVPPFTGIVSQTGSFDGSICNSRCTDILASDTGATKTGIASITAVSAVNMNVTIPKFAAGVDSVPLNVCVKDSMLDGSATIAIFDGASNKKMETVTYCTIPDTLAPTLTWDSVSTTWLRLHFGENRPWDRGLDSVIALNATNVTFTPPLATLKPGIKSFEVIATPTDPSQPSSFAIEAKDTFGNVSAIDTFARALASVSSLPALSPSLSIVPNPSAGATLLTISGAPTAEVSVFNMLGQEVAHFNVAGSYEWRPDALPAGTYYVRASIGGVTISKSIVRQ